MGEVAVRWALAALLLVAMAGAGAAGVPEVAGEAGARFVFLEGGRNFRDLGGYRTADGRTVRWGLLYRSGSLGGLSPAGRAQLEALGAARLVDLRTAEERRRDGFDLAKAFGPRYYARDYRLSSGDLPALFARPEALTGEAVRAEMEAIYRALVREQIPAFRVLFADLAAGRLPLVFFCSAGKDRTGIAAALVLTALGVPYSTVREDYLLSNGAPGMAVLTAALPPAFARLPEEVRAPLVGVDGAWLDAAFAQIRADYGSVERYLEEALGVGPRQRALLRRHLLQ